MPACITHVYNSLRLRASPLVSFIRLGKFVLDIVLTVLFVDDVCVKYLHQGMAMQVKML